MNSQCETTTHFNGSNFNFQFVFPRALSRKCVRSAGVAPGLPITPLQPPDAFDLVSFVPSRLDQAWTKGLVFVANLLLSERLAAPSGDGDCVLEMLPRLWNTQSGNGGKLSCCAASEA